MIKRSISYILIGFVKVYQKAISPLLGNNCRYTPTCSQYMILAIQEWGPFKGSILGLKRIGRCHPLSKTFGPDPVPPNPKKKI